MSHMEHLRKDILSSTSNKIKISENHRNATNFISNATL